jgi:CDGSH-type Zn-finger protein
MSEPKIAARKPEVLTLEPGTYYWCACGLSANQPFCSGAHKGSTLTPMKFELTEPTKDRRAWVPRSGRDPLD